MSIIRQPAKKGRRVGVRGARAMSTAPSKPRLPHFPHWAATPPLTRARILFKFRELLNRERRPVRVFITREHGKTLPEARG